MSTLEIQKAPVRHGWVWISHGYKLIMRSPLQALPISMLFALCLSMATIVPMVGIFIAIIIMPVLMAGYMRVCHALEYNERVEMPYLFDGFKNRASQLVSLGGMLLLGMILISIVTAAMGGETLSRILQEYQASQDMTALVNALMSPDNGLRMMLLMTFGLFFILMLAMQFAPMLIYFNQMTPLVALQVSFRASIHNILPFSVYSLIIQLIAFGLSVIPYGLGWIVLLPLGLTSMYVAYRDIFNEVKEVEGTSEVTQEAE